MFFSVFAIQIELGRYVPTAYWLTVMLFSVLGTLLTDNLTDNLGVPLETSTIVFSVLLGLVAGDANAHTRIDSAVANSLRQGRRSTKSGGAGLWMLE